MEAWQLLKNTAFEWWKDNTFRLAASLAFYTIFSLAPVLLIGRATMRETFRGARHYLCVGARYSGDAVQATRFVMRAIAVFGITVCLNVTLIQAAPEGREIQWRSGPATLSAGTNALDMAAKGGNRHVVVQFRAPLSEDDRKELESLGIRLGAYVGADAYFAALPAGADTDGLRALPSLLAVDAIQPQWKLHPQLLGGNVPEFSIVDASKKERVAAVYVVFHPDVDLKGEGLPLIDAMGGTVRSTMSVINGAVAELPENRIPELAADDRVQWVEPPLSLLQGNNFENAVAIEARDTTTPLGTPFGPYPYNLNGTGIMVMVYDNGTARGTHNAFAGRLVVGEPGVNPSPGAEHPTHVAGTIGSNGGNTRRKQHAGMAPNALMVSYGLQPRGSGISLYTDPGDIETDYGTAIENYHADIANNSIGMNIESSTASPADCAMQGDYGVTDGLIDGIVRGGLGSPFRVVWANGNERKGSVCNIEEHSGDGYYSIAPPAGAKNHITVGAVNAPLILQFPDSLPIVFPDDSMTYFSSWGPTDDGRMKPDVSAPGCQASLPLPDCLAFQLDDRPNECGVMSVSNDSDSKHTRVLWGTSMAAPTVTGALALLLQDYRADFPAPHPLPRNSTLKVLLAQTAVDRGNVGPDYQFGYGSIRIKQAIDQRRAIGRFRESEVTQGGLQPYYMTVASGTAELKVTIAWDDYPGTPNTSGDAALVNDLDVIVRAPNGVVYYPWTLDPSSPASPAVRTARNTRDNIEQVLVDNPTAGTWSIEVTGYNVPQGPQSFSITASSALCPTATPLLSAPPDGATGLPTAPVLDWEDLPDALSYQVQVATDAAFTSVVASPSVTAGFWNVTPALNAGTTYYWRVRSVDSCGTTSPWSAARSFTTCSAPAAPLALTPSNGAVLTTVTAPTLDWADVPGTTYEVQVSTSATFVPITRSASNLAASTWNVSPALATGTRYYWRVRAIGTCAPSAWSTTRTFDLGCIPTGAAFDPARQAPACAASACGCTTGNDLVKSRDSISGTQEQNQPNTINDSCPDGTSGSFHNLADGDSVDRIDVLATDGLRLRPGGTASVKVTVWCRSEVSFVPPTPSDFVDLYYTSNASNPSWTQIASNIRCDSGGTISFTRNFTLANVIGSHAVRAQVRYEGTAGACVSGPTNDRDDLVFTVEGVPQEPIPIEAGYAHTVAVYQGRVVTMGLNDQGQLGDGSTTTRSEPRALPDITNALAVVAGTSHTVTLLQDGSVKAWGNNSDGQLGDGSTAQRTSPVSILDPSVGVVTIAAGSRHTLALKRDGTVLAWGDNTYGQLGNGDPTHTDRLVPTAVSNLTNVVAVAAGFYHSVAVKGDGTVWTWGLNNTGQLGDGTHTDRDSPVLVPGLTGVRRVAAGAYFSFAGLQNGTLKGWGHNAYGQLGDGTALERPVPVTIPLIADILRIAPGSGFTLALRADGTVWSTGQNVSGQLGNGTTAPRANFGPVVGLPGGVTFVGAGEDHSLASVNLNAYGWGKNLNGQLANAPNNPQLQPWFLWAIIVGVP
ncbi:MAG TPA: S8 family serine peptidase [Candidatus Polarisedimenticolaceae bacterium]|nr:S8 family serine peptidase [Candidatus Polarisedimenticolaceae bacterium]